MATLTYAGEGLHQRTSASALRTLGLDLLIARSVLDYEALAVKLARHPKVLTAIRLRLLCSRPLGNYSDINLSMCLPHRMAGEWMGEEEPRAEVPQHGVVAAGSGKFAREYSCRGPNCNVNGPSFRRLAAAAKAG